MIQKSLSEYTEEQRKTRLLHLLLLSFGAFVLVGLAVALTRPIASIVAVAHIALLLLLAGCYGLSRRGRLRLASVLFVGGWVLIGAVPLMAPTTHPVHFFTTAYIVSPVVVVASLLITPYSSFVMVAVVGTTVLAAMALRGGWNAADLPETQVNEGVYLIMLLAVSIVLAAISWLFGRDVTRATRCSETNAQALGAQLAANESLIAKVVESADRLAPLAEQLAATTEQIRGSAEQAASASTQMALGTGSQARQTEEAAKAMSRLADTTRHIGDDTRQAGQTSAQAQSLVQNTALVIQALGDKLGMIDQVVALVDKITGKTNLLAVNASIEAARAGEYGAGFAVVADEVRRLAEHSARSMGEISVLSQEIGEKLDDVLAAMEEMQAGTTLALSLTQQVATMTGEQEKASAAMVEAVKGMAAVAEENAAATEEIAASSEGQVASIEQVADSAQVLVEVVNDLRHIVSGFTTPADLV